MALNQYGIGGMVDLNRSYPGLPKELEPFSAYIMDSGLCVMCIPEKFRVQAGNNPDDYEVGIPTKYVLTHQYGIENGYVFIDVPYDDALGVVVDEEYEQYSVF